MANLTQTAYITRLSIKLGVVALIAYVVVTNSWTYIRKVLFPPPPPKPPPATTAFGKIPSIKFSQDSTLPKLSYTLETITGSLPTLDDMGKVYTVIKSSADLLSQDRMRDIAKSAGFSEAPTNITDRLYRYTNNTSVFEIDVITNDFSMKYNDYMNDSSILAERKLPTSDQAISEAKNFLGRIGLLPVEIQNGKGNVYYYRFTVSGMVPAISTSEADFMRISLLKEEIDKLRVLPEKPINGPVTFLFSGARDPNKRILEINYKINKIDRETFATYPLKPLATAWEELSTGKGYVADLGDNPNGNITIRNNIYLAYYDPNTPQDFIQPIYVFEGDRGFLGYVSALDPKWTD